MVISIILASVGVKKEYMKRILWESETILYGIVMVIHDTLHLSKPIEFRAKKWENLNV